MTTSLTKLYDLTGQVALITGGAQGIGHAIATVLAEQGARVVIVDMNPKVNEIAAALGNDSYGVSIDVRDEALVRQGVEDIAAKTGRIDILLNNVGVGLTAPLMETSTSLWDTTMAINLRPTFLFSQAVAKHMIARKYGRIVSLASQAALVALDGHVAYAASKAGVIGMTKVMALELGPHGITCNTISPTVINTEMGRTVWAGQRGDDFRAKIPTGRFGEPEEIAHAVLYLASGAAGMINGENMVVDGGYTIT